MLEEECRQSSDPNNRTLQRLRADFNSVYTKFDNFCKEIVGNPTYFHQGKINWRNFMAVHVDIITSSVLHFTIQFMTTRFLPSWTMYACLCMCLCPCIFA